MFYLIVILSANVAIAAANAYLGAPFFASLGKTALATVSVIAVDGAFAFLIRRLPEKWFEASVKLFSVSKKEARLYRRLKINKWKKLVLELGVFTGFHKDKLQSTSNAEYLARFVLESNYGVAIHIANALTGFLIIFIPYSSTPSIAIPVAAVNAVLSLLPVFILRANTPALTLLLDKSRKKQLNTVNSKQDERNAIDLGDNI